MRLRADYCISKSLKGICNICLRDDGIALEYATSAPASTSPRHDAFRDPGTTQITGRSAAKIVEAAALRYTYRRSPMSRGSPLPVSHRDALAPRSC